MNDAFSSPSIPKKSVIQLLLEADLVSAPQLEVAKYDRLIYGELPLEDILVMRGWINSQTVDFFANRWPKFMLYNPSEPLGFYLKAAGLLRQEDIDIILKEQRHLGVKFGTMAVLKGWLKEKTLDFFLKHITALREELAAASASAEVETSPPLVLKASGNITFNGDSSPPDRSENDNLPEEEKEEDVEIAWAG